MSAQYYELPIISKMQYNPKIHHRHSIRLKGYDYSQAGLYFITICIKDRKCLLGKIIDGKMILNDAGLMVEKWYYELKNKYPYIECGEFIVMPNHFHCIVINNGSRVPVSIGADLCVCPKSTNESEHDLGEHAGSPLRRMVQWFKTMTTNEYIRGIKNHGWQPFNGKLWQRNYWEHIIRDEKSHQRISVYILNNPDKWQNDKFHN
jgi:putative transposase